MTCRCRHVTCRQCQFTITMLVTVSVTLVTDTVPMAMPACQWQCRLRLYACGQQTATNCHFRRSTYEHNSQVTEHHIIHDNITYYRPPITTYYSNLRRYNSTYKSQRISRRLIPNINHVSITVHVSLYLLLLVAVHCRVCVILLQTRAAVRDMLEVEYID